MRTVEIVATLGPISETPACVDGLVAAGIDVVRLSMSNGSRDRHRATARMVREAAAANGRKVRLLADLQGRKNRLGGFLDGRSHWATGDEVTLTAWPGPLAGDRTWITHPWNPSKVRTGATVLIDDGTIVLTVREVRHGLLRCVVADGGPVTDGRGVTLPGATVFTPGLSERDADDLRFALELGVEEVALSFAETPQDHEAVRALAGDRAMVIGKVESRAALERLDALADAFDGLIVARGDLGQELPFEDVPAAQRRILAACAARGKTGMVATQVLYSMRAHLRPTRAEVADVAHAIQTGATAFMLTGETGYGRHPVHVVDVLRRIIERTEHDGVDVRGQATAAGS